MRITSWLTLAVAVGWSTQIATAQPGSILPGETGNSLGTKVRQSYAPTNPTTGYATARRTLFTQIDKVGGRARLLYTIESIAVGSTPPPGSEANVEHVWPQSHFASAPKKNQIKCDFHHIYPCRTNVNSARGNDAFDDINDSNTIKWYFSNQFARTAPPPAVRDTFSETDHNRFEPCEPHKGDVARAVFYVSVVYGDQNLNTAWYAAQVNTLLKWHSDDLPDGYEWDRNARVKAVQGNDNPFVLDPTLIYRLLNRPLPSTVVSWQPPAASPSPAPVGSPSRPLAVASAAPSGVRIASWNVKEIFTVAGVNQRQSDFQAFADEVKPDILLLQEVTSYKQVERIRDVMGLQGYHFAVSNFAPDNTDEHQSFEVAILSRFPLDEVTEYDRTPDNANGQFDNEEDGPEPESERELQPPNLPGIAANVMPARGYLFARVDELKLLLRVTHLKSSGGSSGAADKTNAKKREVVAAAIAAAVAKDAVGYPGYTSLVAGDMNTGETDPAKRGQNLNDDTNDGYDDTHGLFAAGLVSGLTMKSLTIDVGKTYNGTLFPLSGPIDSIYVYGPNTVQFAMAKKTAVTHGSDHFGVWTVYAQP